MYFGLTRLLAQDLMKLRLKRKTLTKKKLASKKYYKNVYIDIIDHCVGENSAEEMCKTDMDHFSRNIYGSGYRRELHIILPPGTEQ